MKKFALTLTSAMLIATLSGCSQSTSPSQTKDDVSMAEQAKQETNPLLAEYSGPYGGVPAFDKMDLALLIPALEKGMEINLAEIEAIINNPEPATFENTIVQ